MLRSAWPGPWMDGLPAHHRLDKETSRHQRHPRQKEMNSPPRKDRGPVWRRTEKAARRPARKAQLPRKGPEQSARCRSAGGACASTTGAILALNPAGHFSVPERAISQKQTVRPQESSQLHSLLYFSAQDHALSFAYILPWTGKSGQPALFGRSPPDGDTY